MTRDVLDRLSRRRALKLSVAGLGLMVGGVSWLALRPGRARVPPSALKVVSPPQYALLAALAECWVPARAGFPSPETLQTAFACDGILAQVDEVTLTEVLSLLTLFESALGNFALGGRRVPFTQLSFAEQQHVLNEWRDSRWAWRRTGFLALRGLVMAAYYGHSGSWSAVGYPGPPAGIHQAQAPVWKGGPR